jgi:hypothetical protein
MAEDKSQMDADGYYGEEEVDGGDIDLSFLDDDKDK